MGNPKTNDIFPETINRIADALARPGANFETPPPANYIFWLGAGFSKTAGIPVAEGVVDRLLDMRWRPSVDGGSTLKGFCHLSADEQSQRQAAVRSWAIEQKLFGQARPNDWGGLYGSCLHLLPGEVDRQEFIIQCIEEGRGRLNMAHLLLGQLIKNGFINTVFTTNFDDLVLRALQLYFVVPSVLDPDSTNTLLTNSRFVQIGYLHGKLASYRQRHTATEVKDSIPGLENYLAQALKDHGLVVIGYRGNDETPLTVLNKVLSDRGSGPGRGLFWVTREKDVKQLPQTVRNILRLKDCYWLPNWDADDFMKKLCAWRGIGLGIPSPAEWTRGMEDMLPSEAKALLEQSRLPPAEASSKAKDVALSIEKTSESAEPAWRTRVRAALRAKSPESLSLLEQTRPESEESIEGLALWVEAFEQAGNASEMLIMAKKAAQKFPEDASGHEMLGRAFWISENYDEALKEYGRALQLGGNPFWLKRCIGITLTFARRWDEAASALREALKEASEPWQQAQVLSWLGDVLHNLGRHAEAIATYEEAAKLRPLYYYDYKTWGESLDALGRHEEAVEKKRLFQENKPADSKAG